VDAVRRVAGVEGVAVPLVIVAVRVLVLQVKRDVTKGGVAIDVIAGRVRSNIDAVVGVADRLVVVQVVVDGLIDDAHPIRVR
jgi:hypothetical protein